jgi:hypothetical protein
MNSHWPPSPARSIKESVRSHAGSARHYRQNHIRGVFAIMVDPLLGHFHSRGLAKRLARVEIAIVFWKRARRDFDSNAMTLLVQLARVPQIEIVGVNAPGLDE